MDYVSNPNSLLDERRIDVLKVMGKTKRDIFKYS